MVKTEVSKNGECPFVNRLKKCVAAQNIPVRNRKPNANEVVCPHMLEYIRDLIKIELTSNSSSGKIKKPKRSDANDSLKDSHELKQVASRELRAGILYYGCSCEKWNGLQDQCPRKECRGSPACLRMPPTCGPSQFSNAKHLEKKIRAHKRRMALKFNKAHK